VAEDSNSGGEAGSTEHAKDEMLLTGGGDDTPAREVLATTTAEWTHQANESAAPKDTLDSNSNISKKEDNTENTENISIPEIVIDIVADHLTCDAPNTNHSFLGDGDPTCINTVSMDANNMFTWHTEPKTLRSPTIPGRIPLSIPCSFLNSWRIPCLFLPFPGVLIQSWLVLVHSVSIPALFLVHSHHSLYIPTLRN
jgi:hypothetical protein